MRTTSSLFSRVRFRAILGSEGGPEVRGRVPAPWSGRRLALHGGNQNANGDRCFFGSLANIGLSPTRMISLSDTTRRITRAADSESVLQRTTVDADGALSHAAVADKAQASGLSAVPRTGQHKLQRNEYGTVLTYCSHGYKHRSVSARTSRYLGYVSLLLFSQLVHTLLRPLAHHIGHHLSGRRSQHD